jgi:toxin secretion/phage lysis holin
MIDRFQQEPWWSVTTAFFCLLFGPWTAWMQVYIVLIIIDYASGFLAGCATGTADSDLARRGIIRKLGSLTAIAMAHQLDLFTNSGDAWVRMVLGLFIASEAWSVVENLDDMGVPMPQALRDKVIALRSNNPRKRSRRRSEEDETIDSL